MNASREPSVNVLSDLAKPRARSRPFGVWLTAGFWLLSGVAGLLQLLAVIPAMAQMPASTLLLAAVAALSHVLSLASVVLLLKLKRLAVPLLTVVFVITLAPLLLARSSPADLDSFTQIIWLIAAVSVGYTAWLVKRGVLT